ncbi:MAG: hypothetical protein IT185_11545 [Acidobacteria bacterium]|nr:hypothetical protein [Acidobacteriota bacterium]
MPTMRGSLLPALLGCLIVGGATYQTWQFEQQILDLRTNEDRLGRQFSALETALAEVRAGQAGYVAAGQGPDFWMTRVDEVAAQIDEVLAERQRIAHPDAAAPLTAAQTQLAALRKSDQRARNYVGNDQRLMASDVIFVESLEIIGRVSSEVATARDAEIQANRQEATTIRQYQAGLAGGTMIFLLGLVLFAGRRRQVDEPQAAVVLNPAPSTVAVPSEPKVERATDPARRSLGVGGKVAEAADVCVDIARLLDGRDLPALLSRAATAIGAKGLVLWVIDDARETLQPSLSHGYSDRMVQRLGTLPVAADNVTSVACRTLQAQVVPASTPGGSGALAVPLVGSSGCVGVLAAEVTGDAGDGSTLPLARLVAAQLSAVITPIQSAPAVAAEPAAEAL